MNVSSIVVEDDDVDAREFVITFMHAFIERHARDLCESWGRWYPVSASVGAVANLQHLFSCILFSPVVITVATQQYIELFANELPLRIEYSRLDSRLIQKFLTPMTNESHWKRFFRRRTWTYHETRRRACCTEFIYNNVVSSLLRRDVIAETMMFKALLVSVCALDDGVAFDNVSSSLTVAFHNLLIVHPNDLLLHRLALILRREDLHLQCFRLASISYRE